ncbi:MAG TPA: lysylphosphatidylglycerol synthase domain-containing protein [Steroidobacteraceae bacterium]|jgi:putative membrane protein|nr:lysylphosphatidylglycerol synthase domain-containing protein [Steroidobacteraceae bacterium]
MRFSVYVGGLVGLTLLIGIAVHTDLAAMAHAFRLGGLALLWVIPYRVVFFLLYATGWLALLRPSETAHRVGIGYVFWATAIRDAVDRLLPVASVGGGFIGVRILRWRGMPAALVAASVVVEIFITLVVLYLFTAMGLMLLAQYGTSSHEFRRLLTGFVLSLPIPLIFLLLLRNGSVLERLKTLMHKIAGESAMSRGTAALDREIRASLSRHGALLAAATLQLGALVSGSLENWFALRLFGHPIGIDAALVLESMTQAVRHIAFVVPGGLGVQEAGLIIFGHIVGLDSETALALAMVKRIREVAWGVPFLLSWQWAEGRRLRRPVPVPGGAK